MLPFQSLNKPVVAICSREPKLLKPRDVHAGHSMPLWGWSDTARKASGLRHAMASASVCKPSTTQTHCAASLAASCMHSMLQHFSGGQLGQLRSTYLLSPTRGRGKPLFCRESPCLSKRQRNLIWKANVQKQTSRQREVFQVGKLSVTNVHVAHHRDRPELLQAAFSCTQSQSKADWVTGD